MTTQNKAVIFGASGQDGIYMTALCRRKGFETITVARSAGFDLRGSVADIDFTREIIRRHKPALVFHFAANSTTRHDALFENHETISTGTLNILENVRLHSPDTKVLITGSGVQFENKGEPISEKSPFEAGNAYAIARIQSVYAARYFRSLGIRAYVAYLFHHESPYRHDTHVSKMITNKVKEILAGKKTKIVIGDPRVEKEWGFAGDIVEGIFTLTAQDDVFEATVGTGVTHSIMDFLRECFDLSGLALEENTQFLNDFRPEYKKLISDPSTIQKLGWKYKTDLRNLAKLMLEK